MAVHLQNSYQQSFPPLQTTRSYESSSMSSNHSPQGNVPHLADQLATGPPSRPSSGFSTPHPHHLSMPPGPTSSSNYVHSYESSSGSPGGGPSGSQDAMILNGSAIGTPGMSPTHFTSASLQAQKRAYRQRRKDPSCDACRERKVKCDATDTASCSECSSRNVKCQFTKETNRRMSSIKQVQDLEKQLAQAKRQLNHLNSVMKENGTLMDIDSDTAPQPQLNLPEVGSHPQRRQRPPAMMNFSVVRSNLRNYGRGIFKPPPPYRQVGSQPSYAPPAPELPPKEVSDHLIRQYYTTLHKILPILHWPTFCQEYESVYRSGSLQNVSLVWRSVFFAVLACGTLYAVDPSISRSREGRTYVEISRMSTDVWCDELVIDHSRTTLLLSVFLFEMNLKSAAWIWLGTSLRIAQDIGLHCETGPWPVVEGEMRKRLWWSIYVWDRLLSLELGRPLLIDDQDCDIGLPCPVDDHYIKSSGINVPPGPLITPSPLSAILPVMRSIAPLTRALKAPIIASATLDALDIHFDTCMSAFPPLYHINNPDYLEPATLPAILTLQAARLAMHRHNLSTSCPTEVRRTALGNCVSIAKDSVQLLSRSMQSSPESSSPRGDWQARFAIAATSAVCTHMWRCLLFLCFCSEYSAASLFVRACAAIGDRRPVNIACGRNVAFFLRCLSDKLQRGGRHELEKDEEMMAYVSGDLQRSAESSWVWHGSETGMALNSSRFSPTSNRSRHMEVAGVASSPGRGDTRDSSNCTSLTEDEAKDWGGWEGVEWTLQTLINDEQQRHMRQQQQSHHHQHHQHQTDDLSMTPAPPARDNNINGVFIKPVAGPGPPPANRVNSRPASRISIASII